MQPKKRGKYEVWVIPASGGDYKLLGGTDDKDNAERNCEYSVMFGPNIASKVVETATGKILVEMES